MFGLFKHVHDHLPVAARYGHTTPGRETMFSRTSETRGALVLYRCACGDVRVAFIEGNWTEAEMGIPDASTGTAVADLLSRAGKGDFPS